MTTEELTARFDIVWHGRMALCVWPDQAPEPIGDRPPEPRPSPGCTVTALLARLPATVPELLACAGGATQGTVRQALNRLKWAGQVQSSKVKGRLTVYALVGAR